MNPPRLPLRQAAALADKIIAVLAPACDKIEVAGSIRRGLPEVGDIDIVCVPRQGQQRELATLFRSCAMDGGLLLDGGYAKRCLLRKSGHQLDLWIAHQAIPDLLSGIPCNYGAMLLTYTGSVAHNIRLTEHAKTKGLTLRPGHGVIGPDGSIRSTTEREIFDALGLPYLEPADRR